MRVATGEDRRATSPAVFDLISAGIIQQLLLVAIKTPQNFLRQTFGVRLEKDERVVEEIQEKRKL